MHRASSFSLWSDRTVRLAARAVLFISSLLVTAQVHVCTAELPRTLTLQAPLTSYMLSEHPLSANASAIQAQIELPADYPSDLGVGAFIKDDDGAWFQLPFVGTLKAGHNHVHFSLGDSADWQSEPHPRTWSHYQQTLAHSYGLYFWSAQESHINIKVTEIRTLNNPETIPKDAYRFLNVEWDGMSTASNKINLHSGERWELRCQLSPLPENPYNDSNCSLDLVLRDVRDGRELLFPGFYVQPMRFEDRGSSESPIENNAPYFATRFRPLAPGTYTGYLVAHWNKNSDDPHQPKQSRNFVLPPLHVAGELYDPYVRVDKQDPRFLSYGATEKQFHWPIGINIRSVTDPRGTARTQSKPTPDRGLIAYKAYLDRCALAGINNAEIWMSSWNLALEWKNGWPGFHGIGMYNEANAARLDELLDYAWARNIRVILVINNHGQASTGADAEWENSPYNTRNGGIIDNAEQMFTDPACIKQQLQHRRYIVGRYADHPAILCWKLWTEMNLTRGSRSGLQSWHKQAFDSFHVLDHYYQHPCVSHWSGDYNVPDRNLVQMPEMDAIAIDAYHQGGFLPQLLYFSTLHEHRGLAQFNKPVIVTEFGGNWDACPLPQLKAEHASGFWAALMSGHASSPHLWWFEWVDQENLWLPFKAMQQFLIGEDLRNPKARSVKLDVRSADDSSVDNTIWSRAWAKPGHILGYCLDYEWGNHGRAQPLHADLQIVISKNAKAGQMQLEWWDPSLGLCLKTELIEHNIGELRLHVPAFRRHLAFKLKRIDLASESVEAPDSKDDL